MTELDPNKNLATKIDWRTWSRWKHDVIYGKTTAGAVAATVLGSLL